MAFEKACSLQAPTTEAEVNELIDFTFAELNRRVGRAGFSPGQRVFRRQLRLPSSLLEDDFIETYVIAQTPLTRCGEARLCEWQPPTGALSPPTAERCRQHPTVDNGSHSGHWWLENPSSYTDGRMELKDAVDLACASWMKNRSLDETRQYGCTCGTACISAIAHR